MAAPAGQPLEALVRDELRGPVSELVRRFEMAGWRKRVAFDRRPALDAVFAQRSHKADWSG